MYTGRKTKLAPCNCTYIVIPHPHFATLFTSSQYLWQCGMGQFIALSKKFLRNNLPTNCEELGTVPKPIYDLQLLASSCNSVIILMFFNVRLLSHSKVALVICVSICPELEVGF